MLGVIMRRCRSALLVAIATGVMCATGCDKEAEAPRQVPFEELAGYMVAHNLDLPDILADWTIEASDVAGNEEDYCIFDLRSEEDYAAGHIVGAKHSSLRTILGDAADNAEGKPVVVTCAAGQVAPHAVVALRLSGYSDARSLSFGMSSWSAKFDRWTSNTANIGEGHANWTTGAVAAPQEFGYPQIATNETGGAAILAERVDAMLNSGFKGIQAGDVLDAPEGYFVNSYREQADVETYGHIAGSSRIMEGLFLSAPRGFRHLDPCATVVTCCGDGQASSAVTAYLTVMGYDARSLLFGAHAMIHDRLARSVLHRSGDGSVDTDVVRRVERDLQPAQVRVVGYHEGLEGSNVENIHEVEDGHYAMTMMVEAPTPDYQWPEHTLYWFMFRADNASGRTLTFDITNAQWQPAYWDEYRPVMTYADPLVPGGEASWQILQNATRFGTTYRFTAAIGENRAWIALSYPYLPTYEERYMTSLASDPYATPEVVGTTAYGRPIYVLTITDPATPAAGKKGIWVFAKGHAVEHTPSWAVLGMAEFLLSADPVAAILRENAIFTLIPMLAPDATAEGRSFNPGTGYSVELRFVPGIYGEMTEETSAIWQHAQELVNAGQTIDVCINLHAPHGSTEPLYGGWYYDPDTNQNESESEELAHDIMYNNLPYTGARWLGWADVRERYFAPRLNSRCYSQFGSIALIYEVCMQDPARRLTITRLKHIGEGFGRGIYDYYDGFGPPAMPIVDNRNINYSSTPGWTTARYSPGYYEMDYQFAYPWQPGEPVELATWTGFFRTSGTYAVYAWWVSDQAAATNATYSIFHADGTTHVTVDMEQNGGQWNLLGSFRFEAGGDGRVVLSNVANDAVGADAIRFELPL
jgi:rhodanese-related sulfurtransferase